MTEQRTSLARALRADPGVLEALTASLVVEQRAPSESEFLELHRSIVPNLRFRRNWHMIELFFVELGRLWVSGDALDAAAFALWRPAWIHPFDDGNGRTSRGLSYACLCARIGVVLPGAPTVIEQMTQPEWSGFNHITQDCEDALQSASAAALIDPNARNLAPLKQYLARLLQNQIAPKPHAIDVSQI